MRYFGFCAVFANSVMHSAQSLNQRLLPSLSNHNLLIWDLNLLLNLLTLRASPSLTWLVSWMWLQICLRIISSFTRHPTTSFWFHLSQRPIRCHVLVSWSPSGSILC